MRASWVGRVCALVFHFHGGRCLGFGFGRFFFGFGMEQNQTEWIFIPVDTKIWVDLVKKLVGGTES